MSNPVGGKSCFSSSGELVAVPISDEILIDSEDTANPRTIGEGSRHGGAVLCRNVFFEVRSLFILFKVVRKTA
jgi:hypothetical protein